MAGSASDQRTEASASSGGPLPVWLRGSSGVTVGVVCVAVAALLVRLVALGARPAHFDEARVAYWALYALEDGHYAYRHIVHGPFIQHADRWLFGLVGASDFAMRLPVALVGGLLPLSALLFRDRLRNEETVALALFLAFNPVLLYYSRFMRSDVLVAAFMFTALGMLVRLLDRRKVRYLYGAAFFLALGVASKENSVLYLVTWLGAIAVVAVQQWLGLRSLVNGLLLRRPEFEWSGVSWPLGWLSTLRNQVRRVRNDPATNERTRRFVGHGVAAVLLFGLLWLFLFAPRGDGLSGMATVQRGTPSVGLWEAAGDPGKWPALFDATYSQFVKEYPAWGDKASELAVSKYRARLESAVFDGLLETSAALVLLAVAGFIHEWYTAGESRALVFVFCYAGAASIVGYPAGLSIGGGWKWNNTHILVPLAVPAAVGLGVFYRWGREALEERDPIDVGLTSLILLLVVTSVAWSGVTHVYTNPQHESNELVQFAQPHDDLDPMLETLDEASGSEGLDAIVYSESGDWEEIGHASLLNNQGIDNYWNVRPTCTDLGVFLPAHWHFQQAGVNATCDYQPEVFKQRVQKEHVPVVVTKVHDDTVPREWLRERFTLVGNFSMRYTERADPTLEVWSRVDEN